MMRIIYILLLMLTLGCEKKHTAIVVSKPDINESTEVITYSKTDRNDISPPPNEPWWTIDVLNLDTCQNVLWNYLKNIYPIPSEDNQEYMVYGIIGEPESALQNRYFINRHIDFFSTYFWERYLLSEEFSCRETLDSTFFEETIGEPTCKVINDIDNVVTYFYYIKLRYRRGPCLYNVKEGDEYIGHCSFLNTRYCATLRIVFSLEDGKLSYIDFAGSG